MDPFKALQKRLDKQDDLLCDIRTALLGNKEFRQKGLVERTDELEVKVEKHDRKLWLAGLVITLVLAVGEHFWK